MTVDFILHGVPNGHDSWGIGSDGHYLSTFYTQKTDKEHLLIEARKVEGKPYMYYHYLKYNNVTAADGRSGSYLGITLKIDAYYKDILNVYNIMEVIYNRYLTDVVFSIEGDGIKYKIPKFDMVEADLKDVQSKVVNLISLSAKQKDFEAIDASYFNNENKIVKAFLLDCTKEIVLQALKKYGRITISKFYSSKSEQQKIKAAEAQLESIIQQRENELKNADTKMDELTSKFQVQQTEIGTQKQKIEDLHKTIKEKEKVIEQLKNDLNRLKENRNIQELVKDLKEPLWKLAEIAGRQSATFPDSASTSSDQDYNGSRFHAETHNPNGKRNHGKTSIKKKNILIICVIVVALGLLAFSYPIYNHFWGKKGKSVQIVNVDSRIDEPAIPKEKKDSIINDDTKSEEKGQNADETEE